MNSPHLTDRGRQMIDGAIGGSWSNQREPGLTDRAPHFSVFVQPSWTYFVRDRVGLGAYVGYQVTRPSTGIDDKAARQIHQSMSIDDPLPTKAPLEHELSFGITAVFELFRTGPISLMARPYFGMSARFRERYYVPGMIEIGFNSYTFDTTVHRTHERDLRAQLGLRLPLVYQLSSAVGVGVGPDLLWENLAGDFNAFRVGLTSWIALSF